MARPANVAHVLTPLMRYPPSTARRGDLHAGDVGAVVGFGHHHPDHELTARDLREPALLLVLGAALDDGPGEDLGPGDERAPDAERAPRQLLGGDHHADVILLAAEGEAAVLLGDRQPEAAELGQSRDDGLGDVEVLAVHLLGDGPDPVLGKAPERLAAPARTRRAGASVRCRGRGAARRGPRGTRAPGGAHEVDGRRERGGIRPPLVAAGGDARAQVPDRVGDERSGEHRLVLTARAVVEHHPASRDRAGRVGEVVREHLVLVEPRDRDAPVGGAALRELGARARSTTAAATSTAARAASRSGLTATHAREPTDALARRITWARWAAWSRAARW